MIKQNLVQLYLQGEDEILSELNRTYKLIDNNNNNNTKYTDSSSNSYHVYPIVDEFTLNLNNLNDTVELRNESNINPTFKYSGANYENEDRPFVKYDREKSESSPLQILLYKKYENEDLENDYIIDYLTFTEDKIWVSDQYIYYFKKKD